jgi:hypothetical protein
VLLESQLEHLPGGGEEHFHVIVSTDNEFEFEFPRLQRSPPYRDHVLAELDAKDPRLVARANGFDIDILECSHACPRSHLGRFGWDDQEDESHRWWDGTRWPGNYT